MTVRPALERSSATTLWIRAHCSACAPGGVSQRICQSPWTDRTAPCALAATVRPKNSATARLAAVRFAASRRPKPAARELLRFASPLAWCFQGLIGSIPGYSRGNVDPGNGLIGNDGALKATTKQSLRRDRPPVGSRGSRIGFLSSAPSVPTSGDLPVKRCQRAKLAHLPDFTGKCDTKR